MCLNLSWWGVLGQGRADDIRRHDTVAFSQLSCNNQDYASPNDQRENSIAVNQQTVKLFKSARNAPDAICC